MRWSGLAAGLMLLSTLAVAEEPPLAVPASPPPPTEGPLAIPAPGQPTAPPRPPPAPVRSYSDGLTDGEAAAKGKPAGEWFGIGVGSGCLLTGVGCGAATVTAALVDPTLPQPYASDFYRSTDAERDYWNGFRAGYTKEMKKKRAIRTFAGGAVGTAITFTVLLALEGGVIYVE